MKTLGNNDLPRIGGKNKAPPCGDPRCAENQTPKEVVCGSSDDPQTTSFGICAGRSVQADRGDIESGAAWSKLSDRR